MAATGVGNRGEEKSHIPKIAATGAELAATAAPESGARRRAIFQKLQPQAPSWQPQAFRKVGGGEDEYSKNVSNRCRVGTHTQIDRSIREDSAGLSELARLGAITWDSAGFGGI